MKKVLFLISLFLTTLILFNKDILAAEITNCNNRYITLVNPVRSRDLWIDKTLYPLENQYNLINQYNLEATWLLQYDILLDKEAVDAIKRFNSKQEKGIFLEVSQKLADIARITYPHFKVWYSPEIVFLSSYTQSERRNLIDKLFQRFKLQFGYYPKSVGSWWIDSYSLNYMKEKYNIKTALIVADQKTTDNYGVWGQWWGVPYYPSKINILTPASDLKNKQDIVIIQWAQRDPVLAVGEGSKYSNYSMQANDYIRQGKDTNYFQELINVYLNCQNPLGQVTVGLETGSDSVIYFEEYARQLAALKQIPNLQSVTMEKFYDKFSMVYPDFPNKSIIEKEGVKWLMTAEKRENSKGEVIVYNPLVSFADYFILTKDDFLNRVLLSENRKIGLNTVVSPSLVMLIILCIFSFFRKQLKIWLISSLFTITVFGLILRSGYQYGWWVFYGPILQPLYFYQLILPLVIYLLFILLSKFKNINLWAVTLAFAIDPLIASLRTSFISEKYLIGFMLDPLRFVGVSFNNLRIDFINADFPSYIAAGLLKFNFSKVWQSFLAALVVYPVAHLFLGLLLNIILKKHFKFKKAIVLILIIFFLLHLWVVFNANPFAVQSY